MNKITQIEGKAVPIEGNDIDTDRIIPARYLKEITFTNMGKYPFYDERFDTEGKPTGHPFDLPQFQGAHILFVNQNFGCGSSREHAPQALMRWGVKAIVGESFAEIFAGNCTMLGIPTATVSQAEMRKLQALVKAKPDTKFVLDLEKKTLPEALGKLAAHAKELFGIACQFTHQGTPPPLDPNSVMQLYKIAQEALTNAIKHGKATRATISLAAQPTKLTLQIRNNGLPFPALRSHSTGMGLRIMNYRASLIGASLDIKAKGAQGTLVTCSIPIESKK